MIGVLPQWFQIFFLSMIPWLESRYVIPFAISSFGWDWWQAFPIAVAGNMLPVPFILLFFKFAEKFLRNYKFWTRIMDWLFSRTRRRANSKIQKYEYLGLILFVAIPLPFTGAWTGSLIAYLFDLKFSKSLLTIFIGVIIAASVMTFLILTGQYIWFSFNG
ncbi:MAG: small multi-drug export protein [Thermoplasmatales archaeon]|nr:small multi-drug export protein [Thermoplasmatales archaeon]